MQQTHNAADAGKQSPVTIVRLARIRTVSRRQQREQNQYRPKDHEYHRDILSVIRH